MNKPREDKKHYTTCEAMLKVTKEIINPAIAKDLAKEYKSALSEVKKIIGGEDENM